MSKIESIRNVTIYQNLAVPNGTIFYAPINTIGFEPDELIVRSIVANGTGLANDFNVYLIYCDMIESDQILGTFTGCGNQEIPQPFTSNPQTIFRVKKPIATIQNIGIRIQSDKTTAVKTVDRILTISLDFIKYEDKKNKK